MKWRPYLAYKASGIGWTGEIPTHWKERKLKYVASVVVSNVDKHSAEGETPVHLCNYLNVYNNDFIGPDIDLMEATASSDEIAKFKITKGDVLVTKDSEDWRDIAVSAFVTSDMDGVLCGYHLAQIRPNTAVIDGKYLFRAFSARGINDQFKVAATGITRYGLGKYSLGGALFPVPPLDEQRAIAAFLDREMQRIDALVAKKQRQIELLQQKRAALISDAVTKGLNPNAKMKDSGVEWLGQMPEHWEVKRLKFVSRVNPTLCETVGCSRDFQVSFLPMEAVGNGTLDLARTLKLEEAHGYTCLVDGDVIVAKITPCFENGKGALAAGLNNGMGLGTTELHVIRPHDCLDAKFLYYVTASHLFRDTGTGFMQGTAGQKRVPNSFVEDFFLPLPTMPEQRAVAAFLDLETGRIDALISKVQQSIEMLREYRTALISAAVTGKIDVLQEVA